MADQAKDAAQGVVIVEIMNDPIEPGRNYTDKSTGMQKLLPARQTAWLHTGKRFPLEFKIDVPDGGQPYRPGMYFLGGDIFTAGKFGRVEYNDRKLNLVPADAVVAALSGDGGGAKLKAA